jgi:hypothetical protein
VERRVLRGGSFNNNHRNVRCANRNHNNPNNRNDNIGFRVVVSHIFCPPEMQPGYGWAAEVIKNGPAAVPAAFRPCVCCLMRLRLEPGKYTKAPAPEICSAPGRFHLDYTQKSPSSN